MKEKVEILWGEIRMKLIVKLLTILAIIGLVAGIILIITGNIASAGVIWAITTLISCVAIKLERNVAKNEK